MRYFAKFFSVIGVFLSGIYCSLFTLIRKRGSKIKKEPGLDVIILGNGPSLNNIDLEEVAKSGMDIVCVNFFPSRNENFFELRPKYLCLFDPVFYGPSQLQDKVDELFDILKRVDWPLTVLCFAGQTPKIDNEYISYSQIASPVLNSPYLNKFLFSLYDKNLVCLGAQNVVIAAGSYFVIKGARHIYYAGIDMSEFKGLYVDEECRVYVDYTHSYGSERVYSEDVAKGDFYKLLGMYQTMFEQFYRLRAYADHRGVEITNLTDESYVDVFEKDTKLFHKKPKESK